MQQNTLQSVSAITTRLWRPITWIVYLKLPST